MYLFGKVLLIVTVGVGIVRGFSAPLFNHLQKKDIQQFGRCSLEETLSIFEDYPENCSIAFENLKMEFERNSQDLVVYKEIYSQLCSDECTDQINAFSEACVAPLYTDSFFHACEQNTETGDYCLAALYKNNGMKASVDCYSSLAVGECSESCSLSLTELKNDIGCCVNSLFNVTTYGLDKLNIASHELWVLCGVSELPECGNSPIILNLSSAPTHKISLALICFGLVTFLMTMIIN